MNNLLAAATLDENLQGIITKLQSLKAVSFGLLSRER